MPSFLCQVLKDFMVASPQKSEQGSAVSQKCEEQVRKGKMILRSPLAI